jgi:Holliday junction resolvasome RuvABC endonuclease subunit
VITLGIDPSLTGFGWCVHNGSVIGAKRVIGKGVFETSSKRAFVWRYIFLRQAVFRLLEVYPEVEALGVESPPFGEQFSEGLYGLFLMVNEAVFKMRKNVVYFDPLTVKLLAKMDPSVRKGQMDKADMVEASKADTGIKKWNHNEADAFIIARSAARFWDFYEGRVVEEELTPSERHVFARKHTYKRGRRAGRTVKKGAVYREGERFFRFSELAPDAVDVRVLFERGDRYVRDHQN